MDQYPLSCDGHINGFAHFGLDTRPDLERRFAIGHKLEERESDKSAIDPVTGIRAWAEPELILHVSIRDRERHSALQLIRLQLTRSRWSEGWADRGGHNPEDEDTLLQQLQEQLPPLPRPDQCRNTLENARRY